MANREGDPTQLSLSSANTKKYLQQIGRNKEFTSIQKDLFRIIVCEQVLVGLQEVNSTFKIQLSICLLTAVRHFKSLMRHLYNDTGDTEAIKVESKKSRKTYEKKNHSKTLYFEEKGKRKRKNRWPDFLTGKKKEIKKVSRLYEGVVAKEAKDLLLKVQCFPFRHKNARNFLELIERRCVEEIGRSLDVTGGLISMNTDFQGKELQDETEFSSSLDLFNIIVETTEDLITGLITYYEDNGWLVEYKGSFYVKFFSYFTEANSKAEVKVQDSWLEEYSTQPPPTPVLKSFEENFRFDTAAINFFKMHQVDVTTTLPMCFEANGTSYYDRFYEVLTKIA